MDRLVLVAGALATLALLAWLPLRVEVFYRHRAGEDHLEVAMRWAGGLASLLVRVPTLDWWLEGVRPRVSLEAELRGTAGRLWHRRRAVVRRVRLPVPPLDARLWRAVRGALRVNRRFFRRIRLREFAWQTALGLPDPALTGIAVGLGWAWLAGVRRALAANVRLEGSPPVLNLVPRFTSPGLETQLRCIFVLRTGDIILSMLGLTGVAVRYYLGGRRRGRNERSSHRGADEDRHGEHQGNG